MNSKVIRVGLMSLVLIGVVGVFVVVFQSPAKLNGAVLDPASPAPDFTLTRSNGSTFQLSQYKGNVVLLFFGYTSCPDVCPTTMAELRQARAELDEKEMRQVQVVFITVDPDRDTPQRIQEYASHFDQNFIGLSGTVDQLHSVWGSYGVYRELGLKDASGAYEVTHTARTYVIDKAGNLRMTYAFGAPPDGIAHDLKVLVKE